VSNYNWIGLSDEQLEELATALDEALRLPPVQCSTAREILASLRRALQYRLAYRLNLFSTGRWAFFSTLELRQIASYASFDPLANQAKQELARREREEKRNPE